ncbi:hypothetical protein PHAVU_008G218000 [Phaseolus vulgaris]|uniref:Uncharacterized protein n=1 Tax=Phaseolus vulgaris TaxID=3885 RepID=V7B814_PHAVU|nr:hypothetical protein PHAVU_008G218000g [Phaseolus vulgaris]ESW13695.1 hypothetical protein PHAVU_008G218000g [Phaseolus vulgaris]
MPLQFMGGLWRFIFDRLMMFFVTNMGERRGFEDEGSRFWWRIHLCKIRRTWESQAFFQPHIINFLFFFDLLFCCN